MRVVAAEGCQLPVASAVRRQQPNCAWRLPPLLVAEMVPHLWLVKSLSHRRRNDKDLCGWWMHVVDPPVQVQTLTCACDLDRHQRHHGHVTLRTATKTYLHEEPKRPFKLNHGTTPPSS